MAALDTNILVRWLTRDDPAQYALVESRLRAACTSGERLFVPITVFLELEWVLRTRYRFSRDAIITALDALLSAQELEPQAESALERALWLFKQDGAPDFADCLHVSLADLDGKRPLLTLDVCASRLDGAQRLS